MEWPGAAGVKISLIHIAKERWRAAVKINGVFTDGTITSFLQNSRDQSEMSPYPLSANEDSCFSGHYLMGQGFVVTDALRSQLINANAKNSEVIFPYIKGDDINNEPSQTSGLYAINFSMRELDECEINYPECLALIRELVKPERDAVKGKADRERWWRYARARPGLEAAILKLEKVIVQPFTAKYIFPTFVDAKSVFAHPLVVIVKPTFHVYACLQSSVHEKWVWQYCSTSLELLRYTANTVFLTFPFPVDSIPTQQAGATYYAYRQELLKNQHEGLTKIYNRLHDRLDVSSEIQRLRFLHCALDKAVCEAYEWNGISLEHDFYQTKQGVRFTISERAKRDVLRRLLVLNHQRYRKEVEQHSAAETTAPVPAKRGSRVKPDPSTILDRLF